MALDDRLFDLLWLAKRPDLEALLRDLKIDPQKFRDDKNEKLINFISAELRSAAGNSILNNTRDAHDFPYKQILIDVADKLAPGKFKWTKYKLSGPESEEDIERYIHNRVLVIMNEYLDSMSSDDKAKLQEKLNDDLRGRGVSEKVVQGIISAVTTGTLTGAVIGPLVASSLFGGLWSWLFGLSVGQLIFGGLVGGGPLGLVVAAALITTSASYSKTIPAITRLIYIRLSHEEEYKLKEF